MMMDSNLGCTIGQLDGCPRARFKQDKNEPARFLGDGMTFKAKLIGILEVNEARGDKMCQDALNDLKTAIRAAGEHKQRITISIAIDGLRLRDEKTGDSMYHHPVHKISFIAQDMSDSRAFGYIFGSPDTGHRFFGIKTDKTASQVVIAMRDLFQVVFELKKKEIEMTKRHIELHQRHFSGDTTNKEDTEANKINSEPQEKSKSTSIPQSVESASFQASAAPVPSTSGLGKSASTTGNSEAIADLLDLEDELNSIQQGISQMERITPSDPFGPLTLKGESFLDSFKEKATDVGKTAASTLQGNSKSKLIGREDLAERENSTNNFGSAASTNSRALFFPPLSPPATKPKETQHWFDQETESLFSDAITHPPDTSTSPLTFHTPTGGESDQGIDGKKSPAVNLDIFRDLDPLGTGKTKPYMDKKDFFHELKNPPKKVLKELILEPTKPEPSTFAADFETQQMFSHANSSNNYEHPASTISSVTTSFLDSFAKESRYSKIDPFEDMDPFDKTDPFLEDSFPKSIGFPSLVNRTSSDGYRTERTKTPEERWSPTQTNIIFSSSIHGPLRVSLPPEKSDSNTTISLSSLASRFRSSPSPPEESKVLKRKHYQTLKHSFEDKSDDQSNSPILEEVCVRSSPKPCLTDSFDKKIIIGSPPPARSDKLKTKFSPSVEIIPDPTPDPPPRPKATLFAIKPPPLPPKKQNQPTFRPPARPPSLEEGLHYDYLRLKTETSREQSQENEVSPKLGSMTAREVRSQSSVENISNFPVLPKPPQRKSSVSSEKSDPISAQAPIKVVPLEQKEPSVLNITLNQLDQSGIESIATSLGIPTANVCNMTLQELTKMLATKYLGTDESKSLRPHEFHADFDSNFSNMNEESSNFDKYAVFKELIDDEVLDKDVNGGSSQPPEVAEENETGAPTEELSEDSVLVQEEAEDKYAALRQLSLTAQKSDNLSEELDISNEEDSSGRADNISDIIKQQTDDSITPLHNQELNESPVIRSELLDDIDEALPEGNIVESNFDAVEDDAIVENTETLAVNRTVEVADDNNWATFKKEEEPLPLENQSKPSEIQESSPISSDGKDDGNRRSFEWEKNDRRSSRSSRPWRDEDESWDDQSAKESYWSDESSHDGQSPLKENMPMPYQRKLLNKHIRTGKLPAETGRHYQTRWADDTEDEYEEMRRRRKGPPHIDRERRDYHYDNMWGREPWETDWRAQGNRRNVPVDFRRRCDSDASDKEYHGEDMTSYGHPTDSKSKQYYTTGRGNPERHWADSSRESRSKYKRPSNHKRPSSASDAWRHDRYSAADYTPPHRPQDLREPEEDEYLPKFRPSRKDLRYHSNIEHYGSYDRRVQATHHRRMQRGKRLKNSEGDDMSLWADTRHFFPPETPRSVPSEDTPEPAKELHFKFEDDFISSPVECHPATSRRQTPTERTVRDDWGRRVNRKITSPATDNNSETFASFEDDFQASPTLPKDKRIEEGVFKKPSLKGRTKLGRQDSSASLRKSESINIFSRENDPFEDDDFFSTGHSGGDAKFGRLYTEKSKSNSNVSDPFAWRDMFGSSKFGD